MNEALKYRLVGAAVLLIGLGLLWPLLFDYDEAIQPEFVDLDTTQTDQAIARIEQAKSVKESPASSPTNKTSTTTAGDKPVTTESLPVPEKPGQPKSDIPAKNPAAETKVVASTDANVLSPKKVINEEQPQLDAQGIPIAYVVQLGTFSSWKNADQLRDHLNKEGYRAYIRPEASTQPGPYRVQVGPVMTFALAEQLNGDLKKELNLADTFIRRFAHHAGEFSTNAQ